jgi:hypothetical protein
LNALLKKDAPFEWGRRQQEAFDAILKQLASPPLLTYPNEEYVQILSVDASYHGLGAILSRSPDGGPEAERVIAYASRSLKSAESNYASTHLEALAIVWGIQHFRHYLAGRRFILFTDHATLEFIFNNPRPNSKLARWEVANFVNVNSIERDLDSCRHGMRFCSQV